MRLGAGLIFTCQQNHGRAEDSKWDLGTLSYANLELFGLSFFLAW